MNYKKLSLLVFMVLTLSSYLLNGQGIEGGIKAGINLSNIYGEQYDIPETGTDIKLGFVGGGYITYYISDIFALQPEILFSMKGMSWESKTTINGIPATCENEWSLDYLDIPVLVKFTIPTESSVKPNFFVGPVFSIKLNSTFSQDCSGQFGGSSVQTSSEGTLEDIKSTDVGIVFGGELDFLLGKSRINLGGRYSMGLIKIRDYQGTSEKNGVVSVMLGYSFGL